MPAIAEIERESFTSVARNEVLKTENKLEDAIKLLSSPNVDMNRVGMQRLMCLTKKSMNGMASHFQASHAIVYGGGKTEEDLRNLLLSFMRDEDEESQDLVASGAGEPDLSNDDSKNGFEEGMSSLGASFDSTDDDVGPLGKQWGLLHLQALRVVVNSLEQILLSENATDSLPLNFEDPFWRQVVGSICHNIEWCHSMDVTGLSLKVLRLLHTFEPTLVTPLLRYSLLPYLAHLEIQGKQQRCPMVESEAGKLMRRADVAPRNRVEI